MGRSPIDARAGRKEDRFDSGKCKVNGEERSSDFESAVPQKRGEMQAWAQLPLRMTAFVRGQEKESWQGRLDRMREGSQTGAR
jgi:hypothetical protein